RQIHRATPALRNTQVWTKNKSPGFFKSLIMFKKNNNQRLQINDQQISTIIGEDHIFTGELQGSSAIRIEGKIIGNVNVDGVVVLGEKGIIEGNITSGSFIIYGSVTGNIKTAQLEI